MSSDESLTQEEAVALGLIDSIQPSEPSPALKAEQQRAFEVRLSEVEGRFEILRATQAAESSPTPEPEPVLLVSLHEVASSIDWLASEAEDFEFDSADWSTVDDDGVIVVEGYGHFNEGRHYIRARFKLDEVFTSYCPEDEGPLDEEEDDDDE